MTVRPRSGLALAAALALGVVVLPAASFAQGPAMSLLPQEQGTRPGNVWSLFSPQFAPVPAPPSPAAEPTDAEPEETEPAPVQAQAPKYKLVKVPLPPIPDRRNAAKSTATADAKSPAGKLVAKTEEPEAAPVVVPAPPAPRPTGVFAMLAAYSQPEGEAPTTMNDGDVVRPAYTPLPTTKVAPPSPAAVPTSPSARITKLDLSNPFKPRTLGNPGEKDDDLEDEEGTTKLVEKQVDSVQISCLKPELMALIYKAGDHFGDTPVITSGFRSRGRRGSYHRRCEAADFFIPEVSSSQLVAYLKTLPGAGGVGTYCHTKSVHIDTGEPRNWHQCGFRRSFALRSPVVAEIGSR